MQGPLKKSQCAWVLLPNRVEAGKFLPAEYCGELKNRKAKNRFRADEEVQYESFCPRHMHEFTNSKDDDDDDDIAFV